MNRIQWLFGCSRVLCVPAGLVVLFLAGCNETNTDPASGGGTTPVAGGGPPNIGGAVHDHAHPDEGPHHGDLVELGNEEFHAEVVHGEDGSVSVYVLDSAAKNAVPIDATELTINITHDGKAEQFKLPADRDTADPEGKSSRFSLRKDELASDLDSHDAAARLVVMINGKSYNGKISHHHDAEHTHDLPSE